VVCLRGALRTSRSASPPLGPQPDLSEARLRNAATLAVAVKLIIQIPCFNEEQTLPDTLADLPRHVAGFDQVEWLVIDDGSTDRTVEVARDCGVEHLVRLTARKGLANAFQAGLDAALKLGADVIVNTDGDNQYFGGDVVRLVEPILAGRADMVVGDRELKVRGQMPLVKRRLQHIGSLVVGRAAGARVPDATSGFRAYNREAALQVQVVTAFTYTLESLIQAGRLLVITEHVSVRTNPSTRPSRLFPSIGTYVRRSALAIFRVYAQYQPLKIFWGGALVIGSLALLIFGRFLYFLVVEGSGGGHVQSLILGAILANTAALLAALGVIGDLLYAQRLLVQRVLERTRRLELEIGVGPSHYEAATAPVPDTSTTGRARTWSGSSPGRDT
jgi:glycosyltransferase involved in cell wall biosynthesis